MLRAELEVGQQLDLADGNPEEKKYLELEASPYFVHWPGVVRRRRFSHPPTPSNPSWRSIRPFD